MEVCVIKPNGIVLPLSDIVRVGVYEFEEYEIVENPTHKYVIVGHEHGEKPFETNRSIAPTGVKTVSDRSTLDSLLLLASKTPSTLTEDRNKLILLWCEKYGLPFCSIEASQHIGYLACPLHHFLNFLFFLQDAFWKAESMYEDFSVENGIDNITMLDKNPYKNRKWSEYFTKEKKESLISEFINKANFSLCFEYRNGRPTLYNYASNLISLTQYQFALILLSNNESVPRHCKCCGSMFFAHRKNQLYGPCCTRQKRYAAEKRRKEREEGLKKHG